MKYSVWEVTLELEPLRCIIKDLSPNKKQLRGKWQMFIKSHLPNAKVVGFHAFYPDEYTVAVFDDRMEVVRNKIKWTK